MALFADRSRMKVYDLSGKPDRGSASRRWWLEPDETIFSHIWAVADDIRESLAFQRKQNYFFSALYDDSAGAFSQHRAVNLYYNKTAGAGSSFTASSISLNVLQNVIDTACALVSKNKPKPLFLTNGAKDYAQKQKAELLTKYVAGVLEEIHYYDVMQRVFLSACKYGTGFLKIYVEDDRFKCEEVFIEEILIDNIEGMSECPTQIHQRKYIPRDIIFAQYGDTDEQKQKIMAAAQVVGGAATFSTADIIPVVESWHLKSSKKSKDGKHCISIENCTLLAEDYEKDYYPIVAFRWAFNSLNYFGRGICHEIWKLQRDLDITLQTIQRSQRLIGGPIIAMESGSNISEDHLTSNKLAKIIEYSITPPTFLTPPCVQPELYQHIQYLEDRMYKVTGIAQAQAQGERPENLRSGAAIREANDIQSGRLELVAQRLEQFTLQAARLIVKESRDYPNLEVSVKDKRNLLHITAKEILMEEDDYGIDLFPISGLASSPQGRLDQLADYAAAGYLSKEQVMSIVDFPDLEDTVSLETGSYHLIQAILSNIKNNGEPYSPSPYLNLPMAYQMACQEVDRSTLQGVEEDHIQLIRDFADETKSLMDRQQAQQAQAQNQQPAQNQPNSGTPAQVSQPQGQPQ